MTVHAVAPRCPFAGLGLSLEPVRAHASTLRVRTRTATRPRSVTWTLPVVRARWGYALQLVLGREACGS